MHLGIIRFACYGLWLMSINFSMNFQGFPRGFFEERGVLRLLPESWMDGLLNLNLQGALGYGVIAVLSAAMLGLRPFPLWALLSAVIVICHDGLVQGYADIFCNNRVCILWTAMILVFAPAADAFTPFRPTGRKAERGGDYTRYLGLIAIAVLMTYSLVGVQRLVRKMGSVFFSDAVHSWLVIRSPEAVGGDLSLGHMIADSSTLLAGFTVGFFIISVLEALAFFCLIHRGFAWIWLLGMTSFHVLSKLTMGIFFWQNTILIWLLFWPGLESLKLLWPWGKKTSVASAA